MESSGTLCYQYPTFSSDRLPNGMSQSPENEMSESPQDKPEGEPGNKTQVEPKPDEEAHAPKFLLSLNSRPRGSREQNDPDSE